MDYQLYSLAEGLRRLGVLTEEQAKRFPAEVLKAQTDMVKADFPDAGKVVAVEAPAKRRRWRRSKS